MRLLTLIALLIMANLSAQDKHPFHELPDPGSDYTASTVITRLMDGLGFRYYWATKDLETENLGYKPASESRSLQETLEHLHGLSRVIHSASLQVESKPSKAPEDLGELREETLRLLKEARDNFASADNYAYYPVRFSNGAEFPFWNLINGPVSDAVWHCGQIAMLRRAAGNPMPPGISFFRGTYKNPEKEE